MNINIRNEVYDKVMHWVNKSSNEVSGFGKVIRTEDGFDVVEAYLLDQEVGAAHTDIDAVSLSKLMYQTKDDEGELRWWWHSHVNMSVFWSSTDRETIEDLGKNGWIIATVFNKKHETRSACAYRTMSELGEETQFMDEVNTTISNPPTQEQMAAWDAEYTVKVREKKWSPPPVVHTPHVPRTLIGNDHPDYIHGGYNRFNDSYDRAWNREDDYSRELYTENDLGLFGYGLEAEAKAVGMNKYQYLKTLNQGDWVTLKELEEKLEIAERTGKLA